MEETTIPVIQEILNADTETIVDHQAVADVLSNGEVYEGVSEPTPEEETQQILDEVAENEIGHSVQDVRDGVAATPLMINVDTIPDSAIPTDFIATWEQTGTTIVSGNDAISTSLTPGAVYRATADVSVTPTQGIVLDGVSITPVEEEHPIAVEPEPARRRRGTTTSRPIPAPERRPGVARPEGQVYGPMTPKEETQGYREELRRIRVERELKEKEDRDRRRKQRDRRRLLHNQSYVMGHNDLMIITDRRGRLYFQKTDTLEKGTLTDLDRVFIEPCPKTSFQPNVVTNGLMYDKNMNPLTISYSNNRRTKSDKTFNRIDVNNTYFGRRYSMEDYPTWIIVNKAALMSSGGKDFRIRHRVGFTIQEALEVKKNVVKELTRGEEFITYLKSIVGQIYDEENYEIIYEHSFTPGRSHNVFSIYFQFPNLTISNSIEVSHLIDNLITKWRGEHYQGNSTTPISMKIMSGMEGLRTKFSAKDAFHGYSHSHLSSSNFGNWDQFCMGESHFMRNSDALSGNTSELELETMLIAMLDHIQWESLEGGPYMKMEAIGQDAGNRVFPNGGRNLNTYGHETLDSLIEIIKDSIDFNHLSDAFTLFPRANKETAYTFDEKKFITLFNNELGEEAIYHFCGEWEIDPIVYIPSENVFRRSDFDVRVASSWKHLVNDARRKVQDVPVTYINGKYIRPLILNEQAPVTETPTKKVIMSLHPDIILYVAKIIHYHLLNELKNVKA